VVAQNPRPATQIATDKPVTYTLCKAPDKVTVPGDLVGSTRDAADAALKTAGLRPDFDAVDSDAPKDQVIEVESAGQQVDKDTTITVKISRGNLADVPNVVGRSREAAEAVLGAAGFEVDVELVTREGTPNEVVEQSPSGNRPRPRGSKVTIVVIDQQEPDPGTSTEPGPGDTDPPGGSGANGNGLGGILPR
jgi:serine/threonine-protein kinase